MYILNTFLTSLCAIICLATSVFGQEQTVGLFSLQQGVSEGYTLLAPGTTDVYLIDNCGHWVHKWETEYLPGASSYLLEDGRLLRTCRISGTFNGGGTGGRVEIYDWDSNLLWGYDFSEADSYHQHHDIEYLSNGNILILAWEEFSQERMMQEGRSAEGLTENGVWLEEVLEVKPIGTDEIELVWEWHLVDHLVQNINPTAKNYGVIAEHPEKVDLNFRRTDGMLSSPDYIHANAIDYNEELDQIVLSSRNLSEIWIIDHSTTTAEAATSEGGVSNKGGDLLYRFGNPRAYDQGTVEDQQFFGQHDVRWISKGNKYNGLISVYNNGFTRPEGVYSTVDMIEPPTDVDGTYSQPIEGAFGPLELSHSFGTGDFRFFSPRTSGATVMANDNILICEGSNGIIYEINEAEEILWEYVNPISPSGVITQEAQPINVGLFRAERYSSDYGAFVGRDLTPNGPLELEPYNDECAISSIEEEDEVNFKINSLWNTTCSIRLENQETELDFKILNAMGEAVMQVSTSHELEIDVSDLTAGVYYITIEKSGQLLVVQKAIKQ